MKLASQHRTELGSSQSFPARLVVWGRSFGGIMRCILHGSDVSDLGLNLALPSFALSAVGGD